MLGAVATTAVLAAVLLAPTHAAADECGAGELSDEAYEAIAAAQDAEDAGGGKTDDADENYVVPVHVHVVRKAPQGEGDMPVAHARALTVDKLNSEFAAQRIPFTFELQSIDYVTVDDATYHLAKDSDEEKALYDLVNVGGRKHMNIYIVGPNAQSTATGWAEFLVNPALRRGDHIVLRYYPNKRAFGDDLTVVHEVGHWLGLLHTFHFGCGSIAHGDLIRDTPTQDRGHQSCSAEMDTCPNNDGLDPTDNIMGYSMACRGTFSPGQIKRMKFLWRTARGGGKSDEVVVPDEDEPAQNDAGCATGAGTGGPVAGGLLLAMWSLRRRRRALRELAIELARYPRYRSAHGI